MLLFSVYLIHLFLILPAYLSITQVGNLYSNNEFFLSGFETVLIDFQQEIEKEDFEADDQQDTEESTSVVSWEKMSIKPYLSGDKFMSYNQEFVFFLVSSQTPPPEAGSIVS